MYAHTKKRVRYFLIPIFIVLASGALISVFFLILSCDLSLLFRRIGFSILVKSMPIILPIQLSSFFGIVFSSLAWLIINLESFEYFSMMGESAGPSSSASTNWEKYLNLSSDKGENPEPESSTGHNRPPEEEAEASSKRKVHEDEQAGPSSKRGKVNSESSFQSSEEEWVKYCNERDARKAGGISGQPTGVMETAPQTFPSYSYEEVVERLEAFASSYNKIKVRADFVISWEEHLKLREASPEKLRKVVEVMDVLRNSTDQTLRPKSGKKAGDELVRLIRDWENSRR